MVPPRELYRAVWSEVRKAPPEIRARHALLSSGSIANYPFLCQSLRVNGRMEMHMQIGNVSIRPVVEMDEFRLPSRMFVEGITFEDIAPHRHWLSPQFIDCQTGDFRLSQHAWLIEANGKRIVVDPCVGHRRHMPCGLVPSNYRANRRG
jgi:hypothetical protein